jgi:uncharacterized protein involved in oxidation of intracellular sulfur
MTEPAKSMHLVIINDAPYGNERAYNGIRLALNLSRRDALSVRVFLTGDGVVCARKGQNTPEGYYNIERMLKSIAKRGEVAASGSCCQSRGLGSNDLAEGVRIGNLDLLGDWTAEADKVIVY